MEELEHEFLLNEPEADDETTGESLDDETEDEGVEETPEEEGMQ